MAKSYTRPLRCRRYCPAVRLSTAGTARQMQMRSGAVANLGDAAGKGRKAEIIVHGIDDCLGRASRWRRRHCQTSWLSSIILKHSRRRLFNTRFSVGRGGNDQRKAAHLLGEVCPWPARECSGAKTLQSAFGGPSLSSASGNAKRRSVTSIAVHSYIGGQPASLCRLRRTTSSPSKNKLQPFVPHFRSATG